MRKLTENYLQDLVQELKLEKKEDDQLFLKNNDLASCNISAKATGVVSGLKYASFVYKKFNSKISFDALKEDGDFVNRGDVICVIKGPLQDILKVNPLALSILRCSSGISSMVAKYNLELKNTKAKLAMHKDYLLYFLDLTIDAFLAGGGMIEEDDTIIIDQALRSRYLTFIDAYEEIKNKYPQNKIGAEIADLDEFEEIKGLKLSTLRVKSLKPEFLEKIANEASTKKLEAIGDFDLKQVRSIAMMGYKKIIIPQISYGATYLAMDVNFYKRPYKKA